MNVKDYNDLELTFRQVSQFLALTAHNLTPEKNDGSHICFQWDDETLQLKSRHFIINGSVPHHLVLDVRRFALAFVNLLNQEASYIELNRRSFREVIDWWEHSLHQLGVHKSLSRKLNYSIPIDVNFVKPDSQLVEWWIQLRSQANHVLKSLNDLTGHPEPILVRPRFFDTTVHYSIREEWGAETHFISAGLALADRTTPVPHYYLIGKGKSEYIDFSHAPALSKGEWFSGERNGAIYPVFEELVLPNEDDVIDFMEKSFAFFSQHVLVDG
jgi:hypothetical protein